jgi:GNAT superfamily N-acetyltransferase
MRSSVDDDVLARAAGNCGEAYRAWADALGKPWRVWDDLITADLGLPFALPPNNATLLEPLTAADLDDVLERMRGFFDAGAGGPFGLWSIWPTPDLTSLGFEPWRTPMMVRPAGGESRPAPPELEIVEVEDARAAAEASVLLAAFGVPEPITLGLIGPALNSEDFRVWLGRVADRPVSIAIASVSHGFVGVYAVATAEAYRGRGYGEALTWKATTFRPDLSATLQASAMGLPVYERMGFEVAGAFHCWEIPRRPARPR